MNGAIQKVVNEQLKNSVARTYVFTKYDTSSNNSEKKLRCLSVDCGKGTTKY